MYKLNGIYPLQQIIEHNPPVKEVSTISYPKISRNAVVGVASMVIGDVQLIITERVHIPDGRFVEPGQAIWKQEQADALPPVPDKFKKLNPFIVDHYYRLGKSYQQHTPLAF